MFDTCHLCTILFYGTFEVDIDGVKLPVTAKEERKIKSLANSCLAVKNREAGEIPTGKRMKWKGSISHCDTSRSDKKKKC